LIKVQLRNAKARIGALKDEAYNRLLAPNIGLYGIASGTRTPQSRRGGAVTFVLSGFGARLTVSGSFGE
jgi:hypothetical protein